MLTTSSKTMVATMAVFMVVSGLSVVLRLFLRKQRKTSLKADDYFVIAAWAFSAALAITNIVGVPVGGFGVPFESLSPAKAIVFLKILFVLQFWYIIAVALVKFSVLCFYGRVFGIGRYPTSVIVLLGISAAWLISFLFATFFQVWPLWCNWIACTPTTNYPVMYVLSSATDIVIDISILTLPAFFIRKLHLSGNQKIGIGAIFGLGIFCVVSSVARLAYTVLFQLADIEGNYAVNFDTAVVNIIMWSGIEACASTICANLPCYGPLIGRARSISAIITNIGSFFSLRTSKNASTKRKPDLERGVSASSDNIIWLEPSVENSIEGGAVKVESREEAREYVELEEGIKVRNSVNIDQK
ncbi:uncharacterized protein LY89DRAFT_786888 [Mollisia scopiformis]|uniref:Rhodopsin domain-containing protein n=1 Tax=Mollisia scopiformis TaxID=149040 RepID=A0A194WUI5_MOLSC|nr:uncharacterized protein LY89DRAFT_786888 [Mollisia scopiformis]KUJ11272.1 hypothetical protein LY89DRAFT_786888 [Mollisia scopiformis]